MTKSAPSMADRSGTHIYSQSVMTEDCQTWPFSSDGSWNERVINFVLTMVWEMLLSVSTLGSSIHCKKEIISINKKTCKFTYYCIVVTRTVM